MAHASRWFRGRPNALSPNALLVAGGAAGIAAAFNAPLAGVVFAIEELSRQMESRYSAVIVACIVLAGLIGVSVFGNGAYFGVIRVAPLDWHALLPGLAVALACGLAGGLFARLLIASLSGRSRDRLTPLRQRHPVGFAAGLGLAIAVVGLASRGQTWGSGIEPVRELLGGQVHAVTALFGPLKFIATWLSSWSGVPGGLFSPSLAVGAGIGYDVSLLFGEPLGTALIAMGMAGFLAAVTQAPLTAFIIVMEMIDGRPMVLSLMAVALIAATISRAISRPLYHTLAGFQLEQLRAEQEAAAAALSQATAQEQATQAGESAASAAPSPEAATPESAAPLPQTPPPAQTP
jgi:H+/Cl- antiporter ClcA